VGQQQAIVFGRPFVKRFHLYYQTVVCLSVLSLTLVHCCQTVGRIKMKLGVQGGLGPSHIVLDGDPAPSPKRRSPQFGPYLLRPNGYMDQDTTWYGGRPRPIRHCVRRGPSPLFKNGGGALSPIFGPCLYIG